MTAQETEPLYVFARWMLGSHEAAFEAVCAAVEHAPGDPAAQMRILVADLTAEKSAGVDRFEELDQILRTDSTVPLDLDHPLVRGDAQRLHVLMLELQRTCLMTALRGIPAARRAIFVLMHVMGISMDDCVAICESTVSAIRVLETRARKTLEGYLTTRCEHLDRGNACHCGARLGGALEQGIRHLARARRLLRRQVRQAATIASQISTPTSPGCGCLYSARTGKKRRKDPAGCQPLFRRRGAIARTCAGPSTMPRTT
jgi:hypothetical protein